MIRLIIIMMTTITITVMMTTLLTALIERFSCRENETITTLKL